MSLIFPENEVDGETLFMMDSVEKTTTLFPKLKQQLLFLKEREKLFKNDNSFFSSIDLPSVNIISTASLASSSEPTIDLSINNCMSNPVLEEISIKEVNVIFPQEYIIPTLPNSLLGDIEAGKLSTFGPHHTNRQVLIDTIAHDLISKYNIL